MEDSLLSIKYVKKSCKSIIPGLVALDNSAVILNRSQIRGNIDHETVGALFKKADVLLKEVSVTHCTLGGIQSFAGEQNIIKIVNSVVTK
jgi:hypothetical protein